MSNVTVVHAEFTTCIENSSGINVKQAPSFAEHTILIKQVYLCIAKHANFRRNVARKMEFSL